jgi:hypothetical protein
MIFPLRPAWHFFISHDKFLSFKKKFTFVKASCKILRLR